MYTAHWLWGIAQALPLHNWLAGPAFLATFWPLYRYLVHGCRVQDFIHCCSSLPS
jgi:hypothetical protein